MLRNFFATVRNRFPPDTPRRPVPLEPRRNYTGALRFRAYSIFKRGMKGVYQHCKEKHLHRYLAECDFRYSNRVALGVDDEARTGRALQGAVGKRLPTGDRYNPNLRLRTYILCLFSPL